MSATVSVVFDDLVRFQIDLWNAVDARLQAAFDLSLGRFNVMQVIAATESCRVFDIAEELRITVGGTSKVVDRVEAAGYCVRRANPHDRRSSILELTESGVQVLAGATAAVTNELRRRLGETISADDLERFAGLLSALRAANHALDAEAGARGTVQS